MEFNSSIHIISFCNERINDIDVIEETVQRENILTNKNVRKRTTSHCRYKKYSKMSRRFSESIREKRVARASSGLRRLKTHLWHVKRMFMKKRWHNFVPFRCRNRSVSSVTSLFNRKCTLQDHSYFRTLDVTGSTENILDLIGKISVSSFLVYFYMLPIISMLISDFLYGFIKGQV